MYPENETSHYNFVNKNRSVRQKRTEREIQTKIFGRLEIFFFLLLKKSRMIVCKMEV